jgi:hypothetical protein
LKDEGDYVADDKRDDVWAWLKAGKIFSENGDGVGETKLDRRGEEGWADS